MKRSMAVTAAPPRSTGDRRTGERGTVVHGRHVGTGSQPAGGTLMVDAVVFSEGPVIPDKIAIQNECQLPDRGGRTVQRDDIVTWVDTADTCPHVVMPVYLQSIPRARSARCS